VTKKNASRTIFGMSSSCTRSIHHRLANSLMLDQTGRVLPISGRRRYLICRRTANFLSIYQPSIL
jgi:hypothetical protein